MIRLMRFLILAIVAFLGISIFLVIAYRVVPVPVTATMLLDEHGMIKDWTPLSRIDRNMVDAAIAAEDGKFCAHHGFDKTAIEKAIQRNAKGGHVIRGGSTISQQTAKNVFLWQGGGYFRKGLEAWFTLLI
jgi:monofunctional biosynthetic peptidoglycan transglycosylase